MEETYVAMIDGQWTWIDKEDLPYHLHARQLKRPVQRKGPESGLERFRARLERRQNRQGSPLRPEDDPDAGLYWRWVEVDGKMKWVKKNWSLEPRGRYYGTSDSEDSDDGCPKMKQTAKSAGKRPEQGPGKTPTPKKASSNSTDTTTQETPQKTDALQKQVSWGEGTFLEHRTYPDDGDWRVEFGEDTFLDPEESEDRAQCQRFGGLATIESEKESGLRRSLLIPASQGHDCQSCVDREKSFDDHAERKVSFGSTTIIEIPEEFVTTIDEEEAHQSSASRELAMTVDEPRDTKLLRQTTIKFAPVTVVKESQANHLSVLKYFPDFCTASKPIFQPDRQCRANHAATLASFSNFVETLKPFTRANLNELSE